MSYEDKVAQLAAKLRGRIDFHSVEATIAVTEHYKSGDINRRASAWVQLKAQYLYDNSDKYDLTVTLRGIGTHEGTKLSALREAIVIEAHMFLEDVGDRVLSLTDRRALIGASA